MTDSIKPVPIEFPYESKYISVHGAKLHYVEEGSGDPILFLHGMATCNYIWRNIMPSLAPYGRCIALDAIGMGKSDKPAIPYRIFDYIHYLEGFIQALDLQNITLVLHGWGSLAGFDYARRNEKNIKALAFVEAHIRLLKTDMLTMPVQELLPLLKHPEYGYKAVVEDNYILTKVLPAIILRKLSPVELQHYAEAFATPASRKLLWRFIQDLPSEDGPADVKALLQYCSDWLQQTLLPKLFLYAIPGFVTPMSNVDWATKHMKHLTVKDVGEAYYCPQETNPVAFSEALLTWYKQL